MKADGDHRNKGKARKGGGKYSHDDARFQVAANPKFRRKPKKSDAVRDAAHWLYLRLLVPVERRHRCLVVWSMGSTLAY